MAEITDRYDLNPLDGPAQLAEKFRQQDRRTSDLEGQPLVGTSVESKDDDGNTLVSVGTLPDGTRGLEVVSAANNWDLVKMTTDGWIKPHLMATSYDPAANIPVISATFVGTFSAMFGEAMGPGVEAFVTWATSAATPGELKLTDNNGGATSVHTLAAASSGSLFIRWLHTLTVGTGPFSLSLQVRRTGGAGSVSVSPLRAWVQDPALCTSSGTFI